MNLFTKNTILALALAFVFTGQANAAFLPVCSRTPAVRDQLSKLLTKTCETITENDLLTLKRVAVDGKKIAVFLADDFSGLKNLEILNLNRNLFTELPEGFFNDLANLKTLVIIGGKLKHLPDDFLLQTPLMEHIHVFRLSIRTLSESALSRLENLKNLQDIDLDKTIQEPELIRLKKIFPSNGRVQLILN